MIRETKRLAAPFRSTTTNWRSALSGSIVENDLALTNLRQNLQLRPVLLLFPNRHRLDRVAGQKGDCRSFLGQSGPEEQGSGRRPGPDLRIISE